MDAATIIDAIRTEIYGAVDQIMTEVEAALAELAVMETRTPGETEALQQRLLRVMEACAFQDLTGQRLAILADLTVCSSTTNTVVNPLLNGPALKGAGLNQAAADRFFDL